jgi:hypothetical protein
MHAYHTYCPSFLVHVDPLRALPIIYNSLKSLFNAAYRLQFPKKPSQHYLLFVATIHPLRLLPISTLKYYPFLLLYIGCYLPMVEVTSYFGN